MWRLWTVKEAVVNASFSGKLVIASRASRLAMWQAEHVRARLLALYPHSQVEILAMTTRGDQILDRTLSKVGGKGLFVKELELALQDGRADLAVHSAKDVPMELPPGLVLSAVLERDDPRDAFVSSAYAALEEMPAGAVVGTSSLRRQALIKARHPHLEIRPLRGNLGTRLQKLDDGEYHAIILAAAGLKRLGAAERIRAYLEPGQSLPAPGQGALAIEISSDRDDLRDLLAPLNHAPSQAQLLAERGVSRHFGGSCQIPLAAYASYEQGRLRLRAMVATPDGRRMASADVQGTAAAPEALTQQAVRVLLGQDALAILEACRSDA